MQITKMKTLMYFTVIDVTAIMLKTRCNGRRVVRHLSRERSESAAF